MSEMARAIYAGTHGDPPDRSCFPGSDEKWEGYCLGVEEAIHAAEEHQQRSYSDAPPFSPRIDWIGGLSKRARKRLYREYGQHRDLRETCGEPS